LVRLGVSDVTTTQLLATALVTFVTATFAAALVNAAAGQLGFACPFVFVTLTVTVHNDGPAGTWRLVTVMVPEPADAVVEAAALAHVPPTPGAAATLNPEGNVSTKPILDSCRPPAGFVTE
jgi:hypothetical protein